MPGVVRVGVDTVGGTGLVTGPGISTVIVNGSPVSVVGDDVAAHGEPPHAKAVIVSGSSTVFAGGRPVTVQAISTASCSHPASTGSSNVDAT